MGFPAVHWQYEPFDGASAVYRVLTSRSALIGDEAKWEDVYAAAVPRYAAILQ